MRRFIPGIGLLALVAGAGHAPAAAPPKPVAAVSLPPFQGTVDRAAFVDTFRVARKTGVVASPATIRLLTPGVTKSTVYTLIGPPHFGEGITRTWNYVLLFHTGAGAETMRCRMKLVFVSPSKRVLVTPNVIVDRVIWQDQACADRVAAVG